MTDLTISDIRKAVTIARKQMPPCSYCGRDAWVWCDCLQRNMKEAFKNEGKT